MNVVEVLIPIGHPNRPGFAIAPRGIVWHRTGSDRGALWLAAYFGRVPFDGRYGSTQYGIDDDHVVCYVPDNEGAYHAANESYSRNGVDLGVELCQYQDDPPRIRPRTYANAVAFGADLCRRYGWADPREQDVLGPRFSRHQDHDPVNRPNDPGEYLRWDDFLDDVERAIAGTPWIPKEEEMTKEEQKALVREVLVEDGYPQTILAMKAAYDPLVAEARAAGVIDDAQERKLSELDARLDAIGRASAPTP